MLRQTKPIRQFAKAIQEKEALKAFAALDRGQRGLTKQIATDRKGGRDWAGEITSEGNDFVPYTRPRWIAEAADVNYDLQAKYAYFNKLLFDGKLPTIPIKWARLGGDVRATTKAVRPAPAPLRVRVGLEDRKAHHDLIPGTLRMRISDLYRRSELALDQILIHEMIHVYLVTTGHIGEGHGSLFQQEVRRCSKIVGFHIPLKDSVEGMEFTKPSKIAPIGVVLIARSDGEFSFMVMPAKLMEQLVDEIRKKVAYSVEVGFFKSVSIYVIADQAWSNQSKTVPIKRKYTGGAARLKDKSLIDDLHKDGRLVAHITKESLQES